MGFDTVKLEKGMYRESGKTFAQVLESLDPSENYKGTALEGSELKKEAVAAEAFCRACGEVFDPSNETHCCPACGAEDYELLHGRELTIKDMGFTEE